MGLLSSQNLIFDGGIIRLSYTQNRYKRLIFGLSSASEIYQYVIQEVIQGIPGARNISDDIIVFGKTQEIHDQQLEITISRLAERGLTLNREKCVFSVPGLVFFGHKVSAAGISPDDRMLSSKLEHHKIPLSYEVSLGLQTTAPAILVILPPS